MFQKDFQAMDMSTQPHASSNYRSSIRGREFSREMSCDFRSRSENTNMKSTTTLSTRVDKKEIEKSKFNVQLKSIPTELSQITMYNRFIDKDIRRRNLQDYQFKMLIKLEKLLRKNMSSAGISPEKLKLGGNNNGLYEKLFRIEPSKHMSRAQFMVALQKVFGLDVGIGSGSSYDHSMNKLFDSFVEDSSSVNGIEWRNFLFLLGLVMRPDLDCLEQYKFAFSIHASEGALDTEVNDRTSRVRLAAIKEIICVPLVLSSRRGICTEIERCWAELVDKDMEASEVCDRAMRSLRSQDECLLHMRMFEKLLLNTTFCAYFEPAERFGLRGMCPGNEITY